MSSSAFDTSASACRMPPWLRSHTGIGMPTSTFVVVANGGVVWSFCTTSFRFTSGIGMTRGQGQAVPRLVDGVGGRDQIGMAGQHPFADVVVIEERLAHRGETGDRAGLQVRPADGRAELPPRRLIAVPRLGQNATRACSAKARNVSGSNGAACPATYLIDLHPEHRLGEPAQRVREPQIFLRDQDREVRRAHLRGEVDLRTAQVRLGR